MNSYCDWELNNIMELKRNSVKMENIQYNDIFCFDSLSVWNKLTENSDYFYMNQHINKLFCPISQITQNKIDYIPLPYYSKKTVRFVENEKGILEKVKRPYIKKMKKVVSSEISPKDKLVNNTNSIIKIKKKYKKKNTIINNNTNNTKNTNNNSNMNNSNMNNNSNN